MVMVRPPRDRRARRRQLPDHARRRRSGRQALATEIQRLESAARAIEPEEEKTEEKAGVETMPNMRIDGDVRRGAYLGLTRTIGTTAPLNRIRMIAIDVNGDISREAVITVEEVEDGFLGSKADKWPSDGLETRDNRRPQLSDLRESGRIEEDALVVMGVYRESYYLGRKHESDADKELKRMQDLDDCKNDLEVIVLKNNHGPEGVAKLWVHVPAGAIRDRGER